MTQGAERPGICGHPHYGEIFKSDTVLLYKCDECGLIFSDKYLTDFNPKALYEEFYKEKTSGRFGFGLERAVRLFRLFRAFKIFTLCPRAKSILDVGSGRGYTLYYLKTIFKFQRTVGTQISRNAYEFSKNQLGLEIYNKDFLELPMERESFDIVTMTHVLEHVAKPQEYLNKISGLLKKGGSLLVEVPNFASWSRGLTKKYWLGLDPDYHLTFYTPESLSRLLERNGLEVKSMHTFSLEFSTFISTQSFISLFCKSNHIFFTGLQNRVFKTEFIFQAFLFFLLAPLFFLINMMFYFSERGEILLVAAVKASKEAA